MLANTIGIILAIGAGVTHGKFDPNVPFFSQPHWLLLASIWLTNPRALAVYYIFCAQPPVGHWFTIVLVGGLVVPGAWGLYFLPGLSASHGLRITLSIIGFFFRDAVEKTVVEEPLISGKS